MVGLYVSSRRSILKVSEGFRAAEVLADFVNLNPADSAGVAYFRRNWPDFAPSEWWDYLYRIDGTRVFRAEDVIKVDRSEPNWESKLESKAVKQWQEAQHEIQKVMEGQDSSLKMPQKFPTSLNWCSTWTSPGVPWNSSQYTCAGSRCLRTPHPSCIPSTTPCCTCTNTLDKRRFAKSAGNILCTLTANERFVCTRIHVVKPAGRRESIEDKRKWWTRKRQQTAENEE